MFKKNDLTWKPGNIARFDLPVVSKLLKNLSYADDSDTEVLIFIHMKIIVGIGCQNLLKNSHTLVVFWSMFSGDL